MRIRVAVVLLLLPLLAEAQRTPPERKPIAGREIERANDEMIARKGRLEAAAKLHSVRLRDAIRDFQRNDFRVEPMHVAFGEFVTAAGQYFVAMHFDAALPADVTKATLFGLVDNGAGEEFWSIEEQVTVSRAADGTAYYERSFAFPPGNRNATFGFAVKGEPAAMVSTPMLLRELTKTTRAVSRLLVASQVFALDKVQEPDAPFAFGGVKIVPRGDRTFRKGEEIWIFFEAQNPGIDDAGAPNLSTSVTLEGNGTTKRVLASDAEAIALKGVPGHFGVGTTVDASRLAPGEYTLRVSVKDAIAQAQYELLEKIAIVQ